MDWKLKIRRILLPALVCLFVAESAPADTIVLKNGRRIAALSVTQEGEKITYETASGTLTLPRSIVDHIERSAFSSGHSLTDASTLTMTAPETESASAALSPKKGEIENL